jgi:hypothetical protein
MGSYNHDFVSFRRWFFSVISISYGKYGFLSTSHIVKTLSFPVVVVCAFIKLNFQLRLRCASAASFIAAQSIAIGNAFIDYTVFIPLSQHRMRIAIAAHAHRSRSWKLSFSDDVTKL